jgi:hypothetical protein
MGRDHAERSMDAVAPALPPGLLDVLTRHGVAATEGGLLAAFEGQKKTINLIGPLPAVGGWYAQVLGEDPIEGDGPTALIALARAFVALVGETEEGE